MDFFVSGSFTLNNYVAVFINVEAATNFRGFVLAVDDGLVAFFASGLNPLSVFAFFVQSIRRSYLIDIACRIIVVSMGFVAVRPRDTCDFAGVVFLDSVIIAALDYARTVVANSNLAAICIDHGIACRVGC